MDFNFNPPDPEKIGEALTRLKDAFQRAADTSTGKAQPKFEKLSLSFSKTVDKLAAAEADGEALLGFLKKGGFSAFEFVTTLFQLSRDAATDPAVRQTLDELMQTINEESQKLVGFDEDQNGLGRVLGGDKDALKEMLDNMMNGGENPLKDLLDKMLGGDNPLGGLFDQLGGDDSENPLKDALDKMFGKPEDADNDEPAPTPPKKTPAPKPPRKRPGNDDFTL